MIYDCDYFIKKFEAIPEELWCVGSLGTKSSHSTHCAYGFCADTDTRLSLEAKSLSDLFSIAKLPGSKIEEAYSWGAIWAVIDINDGHNPNYKQPTPKQRILAALYDIKKMQEPANIDAKPAEQPGITPAPPRIVYVSIDAEVKKLGEEVVMS